jgi:cyclic pyranopterin monophosphate synthase
MVWPARLCPPPIMAQLTHFDENGQAHMVAVGDKAVTMREAVATGRIVMRPETLALILNKAVVKGDVFGVARIAGIMAAKRTADVIPLCHPLALTGIEIAFQPCPEEQAVDITAAVTVAGQTGVEMEALTAVSVAALTMYDMCKAVDRGMTITDIHLVKKRGGKSGVFTAQAKADHMDTRNSRGLGSPGA